jgi:hypothetical protein
MTKICIIDTNTLNYTSIDNNHDRITQELLEEDIEDYVTSININETDDNYELIMKILDTIGADSEMMINTTNIHEEENYIYQMCHLSTYTECEDTTNINKKIKSLKKNGIATILCDNMQNVYGKSIVLKYKINSDYSVTLNDLDFIDFVKLFTNKKINRGVYIAVDGDLKEIEYIGNPLSWIFPFEKTQNYKYYEKEIIGKIFMFFIEIKPTIDKVNKFASSMYNSHIKGNVYITVRNKIDDITVTNPVYYNISTDLIYKLKKLMEDTNFSTEQELFDYDHKNKKYQGFLNFIDKTYNDYDFSKISITNIDYESKSLNEITQEMMN